MLGRHFLTIYEELRLSSESWQSRAVSHRKDHRDDFIAVRVTTSANYLWGPFNAHSHPLQRLADVLNQPLYPKPRTRGQLKGGAVYVLEKLSVNMT